MHGEIEDIWAQPEGYLHNHLESRIPVQAKESYIEPEDQVGLEKALSKALASLEGIHKKIIEEHFLGEEEKTLARIGREHHLSRERIEKQGIFRYTVIEKLVADLILLPNEILFLHLLFLSNHL